MKMTVREIAVILATILLPACGGGGGGGTFSPLAPGVSGPASQPTPTPSLAVVPASVSLPQVGSTAQVTATISTGQALVSVAYVSGCDNVATVTPSTQLTGPGGVTPPYTLTALVPAASCKATFAAGTLQGSTVATTGATPSPSPVPTSTPTNAPTSSPTSTPTPIPTGVPTSTPTSAPHVGPMNAAPAAVYVGENQASTAAVASTTFTATDPGDTGSFVESDSCAGIASIAPTGTTPGPSVTYTVTFIAPGNAAPSCTATISGTGGSTTVAVYSTTTTLQTQSKGRKP